MYALEQKRAKKNGPGKLRHKHDWSVPKCRLPSGWVQYGHLAVVLTWLKLAERNAEAERHRFQPIVQPVRHLNQLRFKSFRLRSVETHKCDQRSNTWCALLVRLKINVDVPALAEYPSHAGNQFSPILDQWVDRLFLVHVLIF